MPPDDIIWRCVSLQMMSSGVVLVEKVNQNYKILHPGDNNSTRLVVVGLFEFLTSKKPSIGKS